MTRLPLLILAPLALAACNVERDPANDTTTLSVDEQKVEGTVDQAGNLLEGAAGEVREAAREAAPEVKDAAREAGAAVKDAGRTVDAAVDGAAQGVREQRGAEQPANKQ